MTAVEEALLGRVYDTCREAGAAIENIEVQAGRGREKVEIECTTAEALRLAKSLVALRTMPGIETISINLRNSTSALAPFPLFDEDQTAKEMDELRK